MNTRTLSGIYQQLAHHRLTRYLASIVVVLLLILILYLVTGRNHQLIILLIEIVCIAVSLSIFVLVWNSRRIAPDAFLLAIGLSCLFTALLDAFFTFSLISFSFFPGSDFNTTIQFWIAARYFQGVTLLVAVALIGRSLTRNGKYDTIILAGIYAGICSLLIAGIVIWQNFPACTEIPNGYTLFKMGSEYLITLLFLLTAALVLKKHRQIDSEVWTFFFIALLFFGGGELAFAVSGSGLALTNFLGFFLRFVAVYYLYCAIVTVGITRPFDLLFKEVKEREEALKLSEERYRKVVEAQTELISRFLPDGTHVFVNDAYCRFFGLSRDDILGKKMPEHCVTKDLNNLRTIFSGLTPQQPVVANTCRLTRSDGAVRWVVWNDQAIFGPDGKVIEYQSVGRDITKLYEATMALEKAHEKLTLLSSITRHDILNQLTALKSFITLIQENPQDPETDLHLEKMQKIADVIEEQISFTKDYEEMGVKAPVWQKVGEGIRQSLSALPVGNVRVVIETGDVEVFADPLFEKVFYNLIDNALKYGGNNLTVIRITSEETHDTLVIRCTDNGNGISPEDKKKLFTKGFGKHTGLGLFLVREILAITGIRIEETGTFGTGAVFALTVPRGGYRFPGA